MRKINPGDVKESFRSSVDTLLQFYTATNLTLPLDSQKTFLVENSLLATAVMWEGFISDLLVAYINRDSSRFAIHLNDALKEGLSEKQSIILTKYTTVSFPRHLKKDAIEELVDGSGNNITFSNYKLLLAQAKRWLAPVDADRFNGRTPRERSVVDALIALRNHLAHMSDRSHVAMNTALAAGGLQTTGLKRGQKKIAHVGGYLKTKVTGQNLTRFEVFLTELRAIAGAL